MDETTSVIIGVLVVGVLAIVGISILGGSAPQAYNPALPVPPSGTAGILLHPTAIVSQGSGSWGPTAELGIIGERLGIR